MYYGQLENSQLTRASLLALAKSIYYQSFIEQTGHENFKEMITLDKLD